MGRKAIEELIGQVLKHELQPRRMKSLPFRVKAVDVEARTFEGFISTYEEVENADGYGEIVDPGFFVEDLASRGPASADPRIKVLFNHHWDRPIGIPVTMDPDFRHQGKHGCWAKAHLPEGIPDADLALRLIETGIWDSMSFGFEVLEYSFVEDVTDKWGLPVVRLLRGKTFEFSPVTFPANENARIAKAIGRKAIRMVEKGLSIPENALLLTKEGRVISTKNLGKLEQARDILEEVIAEAQATDGEEPETDEQAETGASEEDDEKAADLTPLLHDMLRELQTQNERV